MQISLSFLFEQFYKHSQEEKAVPQSFWNLVQELWSTEEETITYNAVRNRFRRNLKKLISGHKTLEEIQEEYNDIEVHIDDVIEFSSVIDDLLGEEATEDFEDEPENKKTVQTEFKTKQDFSSEAEKMGVKDSYDEFLKKHNINPEDVTNVYFKEKSSGTYFTVQTRHNSNEIDFDPVEEFRKSIAEYKVPDYSYLIEKPKNTKERIAIISLFDAHLDKIALLSETDESSDIYKNMRIFEEAFDDLLQSISQKNPELILFPIGNDFFHTNDFTLRTKKGTDMSSRVHVTDMDAFRLGLNLLRRCIDKARQISKVKLIPIKGNHDEDRVYYLLECLLIAYENQPDVSIIDSRKQRLYHRYGTWLFGFAHGDKERKAAELPSLMATDKYAREHWSEITKGIFFLGDIHHEKRYDYMKGQDFRGCKIMFLRSIGSSDQWHWEHGFTGIPKTAYAFVYDKDGKRTQEFKINI